MVNQEELKWENFAYCVKTNAIGCDNYCTKTP